MQGRARSYFSSLCHPLPSCRSNSSANKCFTGSCASDARRAQHESSSSPCPAQGNPFDAKVAAGGRKRSGHKRILLGATGWFIERSPGRLRRVLLLLFSDRCRI